MRPPKEYHHPLCFLTSNKETDTSGQTGYIRTSWYSTTCLVQITLVQQYALAFAANQQMALVTKYRRDIYAKRVLAIASLNTFVHVCTCPSHSDF